MTEDALECGLETRPGILDEDQMLVGAARQDPEAAGRLYDKYYRGVFGYIYHCTLDHAATEDLTANVFLAAFTHLGRYGWRQIPFRAWLYRIATNEVRTYYRRQKRVKAISLEPEHDARAGPAAGSDEGAVAAEEYRLVHQALRQLRRKYRTVIILRYFEDRTIAEISQITRQREGTIRSQLHRGLAHLQEILVRWGVLPEESGMKPWTRTSRE
jgi:RNA polymerase sigma-70 factor (ECF subfamily)